MSELNIMEKYAREREHRLRELDHLERECITLNFIANQLERAGWPAPDGSWLSSYAGRTITGVCWTFLKSNVYALAWTEFNGDLHLYAHRNHEDEKTVTSPNVDELVEWLKLLKGEPPEAIDPSLIGTDV